MPAYSRKTVTAAYFIGELTIPGAVGSSTAEGVVQAQLVQFVTKYEPVYLEKLLGETLYAAYVAGLNVTAPPASRWTVLEALIFDSTNKISPAANYVYYFFRKNAITTTTSTVEIQGSYENAVVKANNLKITNVWNEMVDKSEVIQQWLIDNSSTYPEFVASEVTTFEKMNTWGI